MDPTLEYKFQEVKTGSDKNQEWAEIHVTGAVGKDIAVKNALDFQIIQGIVHRLLKGSKNKLNLNLKN